MENLFSVLKLENKYMPFRIILFFLAFIPLRMFSIEFVTIGNPNNVASSDGKGKINYSFQISKFEITNEEYCNFLNTVAALSDSYNLFSTLMQEHPFGGINRTVSNGKFYYSVKEGRKLYPVIGVTWMSAIRYCNWLHYNSANIAKKVSLKCFSSQTEGDANQGAYDTACTPCKRNRKARYWLPNEDEWLKAAFFDGIKWNEDLLFKGSNCYTNKGWAYRFPHIKQVGKNVSHSYYGTYDQQGNVAEWVENSTCDGSGWKLALGGSLIRPVTFSKFGESEADMPNKSIASFGLRICRSSDSRFLQSHIVCKNITKRKINEKCNKQKDKCGNEYVYVGDVGNNGDIVNQFKGRVNYEYLIARTELSNLSYCRFLNAVASECDPFGLYDENMSTGIGGGIIRIKKDKKYIYKCKEEWANRPVVYVSYYDIARFCNWMHYGCPIGRCKMGTTEGNKEYGAYDTTDFEKVRQGKKKAYASFGKRNKGALFWIPSENEWYKAAYYDPNLVGNRQYHDYPTRTSDAPNASEANYLIDNHLTVGYPYWVAPVDSFQNAQSFYGTLQQGGNVWEWIEDWQYGKIGSRGLRGGSWSYTNYGLNACNTDPGGIDNSGYVFGARICKSIDAKGWQPVRNSFITDVYECIILLPKSRIICLAVLMSAMSLFVFVINVAFLIQIIRRKNVA